MMWLIERLRAWFSRTTAEVTESPDPYKELPRAIAQRLDQELFALSAHPLYCQTVQQRFAQALEAWTNHAASPNSLVILHSPVEPIAPILDEVFAQTTAVEWDGPIRHPSWSGRPAEPLHLTAQLTDLLESLGITAAGRRDLHRDRQASQEKSLSEWKGLPAQSSQPQEIIVMPHLEQYFLRCIGGWEAIEVLQDQVSTDPSRFWLMSCNLWAWQYLNTVCQIEAYFNQCLILPKLRGKDLKTWLLPVMQLLSQTDVELDDSRLQARYDQLADLSRGIGSVAQALWRHALRYEALETGEKDEIDRARGGDKSLPSNEPTFEELLQSGTLREQAARYPSLPSLTADDRYLLFSVLLHGGIHVPHLAVSLGESEGLVRAQTQRLLRHGVLLQQGDLLRVQPMHYPKIRTDLSRNNFSVGEDH